jgi:hypothetical protein
MKTALITKAALLAAVCAALRCAAQETPPPVQPAQATPTPSSPAVAAPAQADAAATAAAAAAPPPGTATVVNAASDEADSVRRDPFWPVGWAPPNFGKPKDNGRPEEKSSLIKWDEAVKQLRVRGVTRSGDRYFAVVEGMGVVEAGDVVSVEYEGLTYRWTVVSVNARGIVPRKLDLLPSRPPR